MEAYRISVQTDKCCKCCFFAAIGYVITAETKTDTKMIRNTCRLINTDNGLLVTIGEVVGGMAKMFYGF